MMKTCFILSLVVAALLGGCGGRGSTAQEGTQSSKTLTSTESANGAEGSPSRREPVTVWVALDGWETAETLGIVMGEKRGYFAKSRLLLTTLAPVTPALSIPDVVNGSDLIGVAHGPQAVLAKEKGAPIAIVGSLVPHPTAAMIWLKESKIGGIADLKGKTIAIPGLSFQESFLRYVLAQGGLTLEDVKVEKVGNDLVPALVKGQADAIFGGSGNLEGAVLRTGGHEPVITPVQSFGVPDYDELVLVARADQVEEEPDVMRDFALATARGAAAAAEQPNGASKALEEAGERNPETTPREREAEVQQTIPLLSTNGPVSAKQMRGLVDWMYEQEMIGSKPQASELLFNP